MTQMNMVSVFIRVLAIYYAEVGAGFDFFATFKQSLVGGLDSKS